MIWLNWITEGLDKFYDYIKWLMIWLNDRLNDEWMTSITLMT